MQDNTKFQGERGYLSWLSWHTRKHWQGRRRVQYLEHGSKGVCQILCPVSSYVLRPATALITERLSGEGKGVAPWVRLGKPGQSTLPRSGHRIPMGCDIFEASCFSWPEGLSCGNHIEGTVGGRNHRV